MKKIFLFTLMVLLTAGFAACSDSDDDNNNGGTTPETTRALTEEQMMQREAVASVLNLLTGENFSDTTDVDFEGRTYEATIGQVRNESRPSERSIKVSSATLAEGYFRTLVGGASDLIQETSDGYKIDLTNLDCHSTGKKQSLGTLTYHNGYGANDVGYADIDIACIPSLQRISYKTQDQWGDNGTYESGCSYGEVYVGLGRYWICVQEAEADHPQMAGVLINMQSGKGDDWVPLYEKEKWCAWEPADCAVHPYYIPAVLKYIELCGDSDFRGKKRDIMKQSYGEKVFPRAWGWNWSAKNEQWELWDYNDPGFGTLDEGYCHRAYYSPGMRGIVIVRDCTWGDFSWGHLMTWRRWHILSTDIYSGNGVHMADRSLDLTSSAPIREHTYCYMNVNSFYQFPYFSVIYTVRAVTFYHDPPIGFIKVDVPKTPK